MALFTTRDIVKSCVVILLSTVLGAMANGVVEAISSYTLVVLCSIIVLIVFKVLYNIVITIK